MTSHSRRSCVLYPGVLGLKECTTQRNFLFDVVPPLPVQPSYKCSVSILLNSRYLNTPLLPMFPELPGDHRCLSDCQAPLRDWIVCLLLWLRKHALQLWDGNRVKCCRQRRWHVGNKLQTWSCYFILFEEGWLRRRDIDPLDKVLAV